MFKCLVFHYFWHWKMSYQIFRPLKTLSRNVCSFKNLKLPCQKTFLQSGFGLLRQTLPQVQCHQNFLWTCRGCQGTSILSSVRTSRGNLHNVFPHWETTRGSKLKKTQLKIQETKRIVSEKIESMENIWTVPNGLCVLRIASTPFLGYMVVTEAYPIALGIFIFAGLTDLLDGYIARKFPGQQSVFGSLLDPAADKFLVATLFLTLTVEGFIPIPLTALIVARDVCLVGAVFHIRYKSLPPPRTLLRYFDATLPTTKLSPNLISKVNTSIQLSLVAFTLAAPVFDYVDHPCLHFLWYLTASTTVISGISYLLSKGTYTILTKTKHKDSS